MFHFRIHIMHAASCVWLLVLASFCRTAQAQEQDVWFERFGMEDGLSQYSVLCMLQDRQGFLWIGTQDGLNRYDGYSFKVSRHEPADSASLADDYIYALHEDRDGAIWIGARGGWLSKLDRLSGRFSNYSIPADLLQRSASPPSIYDIERGRTGELWLATDAGLLRFDSQTERFTRHGPLSANAEPSSRNIVRALSSDQSGGLWVGGVSGLFSFDPAANLHTKAPPDRHGNDIDSVLTMHLSRDGTLWIGTFNGGLVRCHPHSRAVERYRFNRDDPYSLSDNRINALTEDQQGQLWVGTDAGVNVLDPATGRFARHTHDAANAHSISNNEILSLLEDRTGIIWVGSWSGLNKRSPLAGAITHYGYVSGGTGLNAPRVVAICEDRSGTLWVGMLGGGLNRIDMATGTITSYTSIHEDTTSLSNNDVVSILEDSKGRLWIGTLGGGLNLLDRETGRFRRYVHGKDSRKSLTSNKVVSVYEDRAGILWIGTVDGGLNRFDPETGSFEAYQNSRDDASSLSSNYAWPIYEDSAGNLWVGAIDGGLNRLDRTRKRFTRYAHQAQDSASLSSNRVYALLEDAQGALWVGTTEGLNRLDQNRERFKSYRTEDGLPHNHIVGMLFDDQGYLWLSTNDGLSRFDPRLEQFVNYTSRDGLQNAVFHVGAACKSRTGELFFGGPDGFYIVDPRRIRTSLHPPPVVLTDFRVFDQPFFIDRTVEGLQQVVLRHDENFFSLEFAALDYAAPAQNRYTYLLENFDKTWSNPGPRQVVRYTNVPPGRYTFRVKASNGGGVWNDAGLAIPISIRPPFWDTWPFRLLAYLLILLLLYLGYHYRMRQILSVERLRMRIAGNLHDDIGANLSSIAIKSEMVLNRNQLKEPEAQRLTEISRTARETAHTLREIVWVVNTGYDTLDQLITKLEDVTSAMLDGHLAYSFERPPQPLPHRLTMDFRQNIYFLYKEILHNIVKHAHATHVEVKTSFGSGSFSIEVLDDGAGFSEAYIKAGNGLHLMRKRASDLGGRLQIISEPGKGTCVSLLTKVA